MYTQVLPTEDGTGGLYVLTRRTYRYSGAGRLPTDEALLYKILQFERKVDLEADKEHITFRSQACYVPMTQGKLIA